MKTEVEILMMLQAKEHRQSYKKLKDEDQNPPLGSLKGV